MDRIAVAAGWIALSVTLAGCSAAPMTPHVGGTAGPASPVPSATAAGTKTGSGPLVVSVEGPARGWRDVVPLVERALRYWERNDARYAGREIEFALRPGAASPDVVVEFVPRSTCGPSGAAVGYATPLDRVRGSPAVVCVASEYADTATLRVLEHEFGHLLGLGHGEGPPVMEPQRDYLRLPVPGEPVRSLSWNRSTVRVYVDVEGIYALRKYRARRQIEHVLAYYEAGASGVVPRRIAFRRVGNRSRADVVIEFPTTSPCAEEGWGSCGTLTTRRGADRPRLAIAVTNVHREAIGWHVGYWLGFAFATEKSVLAPPFRRADRADRRSTWWNETT